MPDSGDEHLLGRLLEHQDRKNRELDELHRRHFETSTDHEARIQVLEYRMNSEVPGPIVQPSPVLEKATKSWLSNVPPQVIWILLLIALIGVAAILAALGGDPKDITDIIKETTP